MGFWEFIVPEATTNLIHNPQFRDNITDGWTNYATGAAAGTRTWSSAHHVYGPRALYLSKSAGAAGDYFGVSQNIGNSVSGEDYIGSCWVRLNNSGLTAQLLIEKAAGVGVAQTTSDSATGSVDGTNTWIKLETSALTANATGDSISVYLRIYGTPTVAGYFDAIQVEVQDHVTTYCDGDQEGCEWNGPLHNSTSSRSAVSRTGGRVYDFEDDYSFSIVDWQGWGVPPHRLDLSPYKVLPGGALGGVKIESNVLTLVGYFQGSTLANLHSLRQALVEELAHDRYPPTDQGWQPIRIRYTGAGVEKEARVFYDSGLEGSSMVGRGFTEQMPVRFLMADPFWYEIGESSTVLDTNDTATLRYLAGRLKSTGQWDDMGLTANPAANGTIYAICHASDGSVYFGGDFDGLNNDGAPADAGCDYIARYDPEDETFNVLVGASDVGDIVYCISEGPDGTIYIGGRFTAVNGVGAADYVVSYDPDADTWGSLGDPDSGAAVITDVRDMAWDSEGNLYIVGDFQNFADVANADYIAKWDGSSWTAVGSGGTTMVHAIAIDSQDNIYIGGSFSNWAGDGNADYWAWWNGSAWAAVDDIALNNAVLVMIFNEQDELFVGGSFNDADDVGNADYIFKWTGYAIEALGIGVSDTVRTLALAPDGTLWVAGDFTTAGSISTVDYMAVWNGSSWAPPDVNLSGTPAVYAIAFGPADPVVPANYDTYLGFSTTGTGYFAGDTTVRNDGSTAQYPVIRVSRSGGTSARLVSIKNWTTGDELFCDYSLLDGEEIVIDCRPLYKSITSTFFGNQPKAVLPNSDFGAFYLQVGTNIVTIFVDVVGGPTVRAYMLWQDIYRGMD